MDKLINHYLQNMYALAIPSPYRTFYLNFILFNYINIIVMTTNLIYILFGIIVHYKMINNLISFV